MQWFLWSGDRIVWTEEREGDALECKCLPVTKIFSLLCSFYNASQGAYAE